MFGPSALIPLSFNRLHTSSCSFRPLSPISPNPPGIRTTFFTLLAIQSRTTFSEPLAALGLTAATWLTLRAKGDRALLLAAGAAFGFAAATRLDSLVAAPGLAVILLGTIPASFLFGALLVGANKLQRVMQVPSALIVALNGLVVVFVVSSEIWRRRRQRRRLTQALSEQSMTRSEKT